MTDAKQGTAVVSSSAGHTSTSLEGVEAWQTTEVIAADIPCFGEAADRLYGFVQKFVCQGVAWDTVTFRPDAPGEVAIFADHETNT